MDCLVMPCYVMMRRSRRSGYRPLEKEDGFSGDRSESPVTVVVGKEKKVFLVDPFVLHENPFRVLMETMKKEEEEEEDDDDESIWFRRARQKKAIFVDVDAILFEHMLWLMYNDCSSLFDLNVKEIVDFYAQDS